MDPVPHFTGLLGGSVLFDTNDGPNLVSEDNADHGNCGHSEDNGTRVNEFVSSSGKIVKLRRKGRFDVHSGLPHYSKTTWRDDETYGININALLDRIEARSGNSMNVSARTKNTKIHKKNKLWVEKWRPKSFLDLVGNERTNRRVLRWLRQWAPCVFNEALPKKSQKEENEESDKFFDPLQRPQKKILLIHGPPGIGKTSVTHVVAKQAGFSVAEINASDERAGPQVRDKVNNTLFNHTFNESAVCLIADEIDGSVESGFIKVLIDIINKDAKATQKLLFGSKLKSQKKATKKSSQLLLRPIVAICNNLYAPALEKLKPHCEIVSFKRPSDGSLQERLELICQTEGIDVSLKVLKDLMDLAQGDIRNCINNLQFLSSHETPSHHQGQSGENSNSFESSSKDYSVSWFKIANQIFRKSPYKDSRLQSEEMMRQVELSGNYDRIIQGCHSLYPHQKYSDTGVMKPAAISEWLIFHDLMFKSLFEHNGELLRYSAVVPLAFFNYFSDLANREDSRIKNSDFELKELQKGHLDICKLLLHRISTNSPSRVPFIRKESLIIEYLPFVDFMLSSDLSKCRDIKSKQAIYTKMVDILNSFNLTLQQKYNEGFETRQLLGIEPPIDSIVILDPKRQKEVLTKRPAIYNVLLAKSEENKARKRHYDQTAKEREKNAEIRSKKSKLGTNTVDFFKSQYGLNDQNTNECQNRENDDKQRTETRDKKEQNVRIWVKFKEGFSDAVRKNVSWNDLWD